MSFKLNKIMINDGKIISYSHEFRNTVENHLSHIIKNSKTITIEQSIAYKYTSDFYGLLSELKKSMDTHWTTLRINGYLTPTEYQGETEIIIPDDYIFNTLVKLDTIHKRGELTPSSYV